MLRINGTETVYTGILTSTGGGEPWKLIDGKPRISSMPYLYDVAEGNVTDHTIFEKYAINDDVDSATEEDVWSVGGSYAFPAANIGMEVVSSSSHDDILMPDSNVGTGIHQVRIYYLDSSFAEKTVDVNTNGTVAVNTSSTDMYRVNRIRPLIIGTSKKAVGNVDVRAVGGAVTYSRLAIGFTKGRQLIYTVPAGKVLFIERMSGSCGGTTAPKYGKFTLRSTWDNIASVRQTWFTAYAEVGVSSGFFTLPFECPIKFPAGSDVIVSCKTLDDNCYVTASLRGWTEAA